MLTNIAARTGADLCRRPAFRFMNQPAATAQQLYTLLAYGVFIATLPLGEDTFFAKQSAKQFYV
ncbi:hypothetical protein PAT3040_05508 [Paenibacillus agaridevorans]|uniref:Uncharacterized protein n=1 Tax=Paenibacillus agaridevorans TaxID=171404 RepID=A0A2R5EVL8_9BACL|nr:hypothetical protein PAT3040_05508 [Paenibacillus agaridevorans]